MIANALEGEMGGLLTDVQFDQGILPFACIMSFTQAVSVAIALPLASACAFHMCELHLQPQPQSCRDRALRGEQD